MADETKVITTTFDHHDHHKEHEAHRQQAIEHFGGHVHIVRSNTSSVPTHDAEGLPAGNVTVMTTVWKKAPEEPIQDPSGDHLSAG